MPRLEYGGVISAYCNLCLLGSNDSPASASQVGETIGTCHHIQLISVFLVEIGFHHVGQAGFEFPTSGDQPTLASQSARITSVSYCAQLRAVLHGDSAHSFAVWFTQSKYLQKFTMH